MMIVVFTLITVIAFTFAIYHFSGIRELYNKTAHIHGPKIYPLIGCAYLILFKRRENALYLLMQLAEKYVSPLRFAFGTRVWVIIKDPDQIKTVLLNSKTVEKDNVYKFIRLLTGNGLLTSKYKLWRVHRKLLQPTFGPKMVQTFVSNFQKNSLLLTKAVEKRIDCEEFNLFPQISKMFFNNICESSMGVSINTQKEEIEQYLNKSQRAFELLFQRFIQIWLYSDKFFNWSRLSNKICDCVDYIYKFTDNVIQERKKYLQSEAYQNEGNSSSIKPSLDMLLEVADNGKMFTDKEISEHVVTFIIGGYDTTARTVNFILLMLASHPKIQDKVYEEILNIFGTENPENNPIKLEDLQHLKYLERVIKETMRLFPTTPIITRHVSQDLELGGCRIPKNCGIAIFILALHRDEKIWHDPLKFEPDRFLPEAMNGRHSCAYIPFSFGSRDCIGRTYAMMSMKVFIVTFLQNYIVKKEKIIPINNIKLQVDMLLQTVEPITLKIEKR